jgi:hypothetical protein
MDAWDGWVTRRCYRTATYNADVASFFPSGWWMMAWSARGSFETATEAAAAVFRK